MEKAHSSAGPTSTRHGLEENQAPSYPTVPPMEPPPPYSPNPAPGIPPYVLKPPPRVEIHVARARMGPQSQRVTCGSCGAHVMTETRVRPGLLTYLLCSALILLSCVWGCCLIPCCVPECQDVDHRCPSCAAHLGTFKRL